MAQEDDCAYVRLHPFAVVGQYKTEQQEQQRSAFALVGNYPKPAEQRSAFALVGNYPKPAEQRSAFALVGNYQKPVEQRSAFALVGNYQKPAEQRSAFALVGNYQKPVEQRSAFALVGNYQKPVEQRSAFALVGNYPKPAEQRSAFALVGGYKKPSQKRSAFGLVGNYQKPAEQRSAFALVGGYQKPAEQRSAFGLVGGYQKPAEQRSAFALVGNYQKTAEQRSAFSDVGAYQSGHQEHSAFSEVGAYDGKTLSEKCNFEDETTLVRGMFQTWESLQPNNTDTFGGWWGACSNASADADIDPKCDMNNMYACNMSSMTGETRACFNQLNEITDYGNQILNSTDVQLWFPTNMNLLPFPNVFNMTTTSIREIPGCERSVVCHNVDNDCNVVMCHSLPKTKPYQITVQYENITDTQIAMIAVCHYETHEFDKDAIAFRILHKQPGDTICHYFSPRDFVMCRKV